MGKESNAVVFKPLSGSTKEYCVFIADTDLVSVAATCIRIDCVDLLILTRSHLA